jgi:hypothetical protein
VSADEPDPDGGRALDGGSGDALPDPVRLSGSLADSDLPTGSGEAVSAKSRRRSLILGVVVAVILLGIVIAGLLVWSKASAVISAGNGTATITWTPVTGGSSSPGNPPQPFTGSINGNAVSGVATTPFSLNGLNPLLNPSAAPSEVQVFRYKGKFAGKSFDLGMYIKVPFNPSLTGGSEFVVKGTYDGQAVHGVVTPPPLTSINGSSSSLANFHGTIGQWKVSGAISSSTGTSQTQTATARFTVTR